MNIATATISVTLFLGTLLAPFSPAEPQQPKKIPQIGFLLPRGSREPSRIAALQQGLHEVGYTDGRNILIVWRRDEGNRDRLDEFAAELIGRDISVLVTSGNSATRAAQRATETVPIVTAIVNDPIENGFVNSIERPGGNITGLAGLGPEKIGKQLEILREVIPRISRVAILWSPANPHGGRSLKDIETLGRSLRLEIVSRVMTGPNDIESAFHFANTKNADAIVLDRGRFVAFHQKQIIELAVKSRLPAIYANTRHVKAGGLMTYTYDRKALYRHAAEYIDKILKGAKPADLPMETPKRFEFVINLKTAQQLGLTIPQRVLARADELIK